MSIENYKYKAHSYKIIADPKNNEFTKLAQELIDMKSSFQLDGRAGTGKSTLLKEIIQILKSSGKEYVALAPTHKACRVLGSDAQTIHSFSIKYSEATFKKLNKYEYIIIDEKSMIKELFF